MKVVSDSSPLITLSKIGCLEVLSLLYHTIVITPEVYAEVVVSGAGLAGSSQVANASWIEVQQLSNRVDLYAAQQRFAIGTGETGAILLAQESKADLILLDDLKARQIARKAELTVLGCVGILETAFAMKLIPDLTSAYRQLLISGAYVSRKILEASLQALELPPL